MDQQALEPGELVVELRAGLRVAVGQVERGDEDAVDRGLDVAAPASSASSPGRAVRVSTGSAPRARMATPFQLRWPTQTAPYPAAFERSARGNCSTGGDLQLLQADHARLRSPPASRAGFASRRVTPLMLKVAILTGRSRRRRAILPAKWAAAAAIVVELVGLARKARQVVLRGFRSWSPSSSQRSSIACRTAR